MPETLEICTVN